MATTATLTATASTPGITDSAKRKSEDNLGSISNRKPTHRRLSPTSMEIKSPIELETNETLNKSNALTRTTSTFRIPKLGRSSSDAVSSSMSSEQNEISPMVSSKTMPTFHRQASDEVNSQQGKRKFSLSQYKERKRLKSDELQQTNLVDTDMRINPIKNSPPMLMDDEPSISIDHTAVISPKPEETMKEIVMKSNLSEPGVRKVIKKKVIWADEKSQSLVQTSFFEVDDSELSEMHIFARNCVANIPIAQLEKVMERDLRKRRGVQDINANDNDDKQFSTPLPALIKILLPDTIQIPQIVSQERFVQEEREKTVLQALFIPAFLPDSPGEPDGDLLLLTNNSERNEAKLIPLDDDTGSCVASKVTSLNNNLNAGSLSTTTVTVTTTTNTIATTSTSTTNPSTTNASSVTSSLSSFSFGHVSPEVAHILAQAKGNLSSATASQPLTNTSNPSTTGNALLTNTPTPSLPAVPNLAAPSNFLTSLFNSPRTPNNNDSPSSSAATTTTVPTNNLLASLLPNLSMNFNLPPPPPAPANFPLGQLLVNALSLGLQLPTPNAPMFPTGTTTTTNTSNTFTAPPANLTNPMSNSVTPTTNAKPPSVRFVSAIGQQNRSNMNNSNEHQIPSSRENSREHHFRRGPPNNHHHHHHHHHHQQHHNRRGDYYPNRQQQNNNNNNNGNNNNNNNNNRNLHP